MTITPPDPSEQNESAPRARTWRDIPPVPPLGSPLPPPPSFGAAAQQEKASTVFLRKKILAGIVAAVVVLGAVVAITQRGSDTSNTTSPETTVEETTSSTTVPSSSNSSPSVGAAGSPESIAKAVGPAVVQIDDNGSIGSGVIYNKAGLILTANHVVERASTVTVVFADGSKLEGRVVGRQPARDLAIIAVTPTKELTAAELANTENLAIGQPVVALGSPFGFQASVTSGIISGLNRQLKISNLTLTGLIQTDAAINPGNSGGPLINSSNGVIGINTAIASTSGGSNGVGFAIPVNDAKELQTKVDDAGGVDAPAIAAPLQSNSEIPGFNFQLPDSLGDLFGDLFNQFGNPNPGGSDGAQQLEKSGFIEVNPLPSGWKNAGESSFLDSSTPSGAGVHNITLIGPEGQINITGTKGSSSETVAKQYKGKGEVRRLGNDITVVVESFGNVSDKDLETVANAVKEKK